MMKELFAQVFEANCNRSLDNLLQDWWKEALELGAHDKETENIIFFFYERLLSKTISRDREGKA